MGVGRVAFSSLCHLEYLLAVWGRGELADRDAISGPDFLADVGVTIVGSRMQAG